MYISISLIFSPSTRVRNLLNLKRQGKQVEHLIQELNALTEELKAKDLRGELDHYCPLFRLPGQPDCVLLAETAFNAGDLDDIGRR
ncbi:hypothetical protein BIW11_13067 [Tropilaelaps mercedesae]|uniref:Uncharacterized protein n=1 Tax=Tropilaelaps mercedesae TaxID=418985 RepID=A0A1V9X3N2_9ACAR|nr:hypothetical protein BIW11_13067 [Tropilaelaps mercedesae]